MNCHLTKKTTRNCCTTTRSCTKTIDRKVERKISRICTVSHVLLSPRQYHHQHYCQKNHNSTSTSTTITIVSNTILILVHLLLVKLSAKLHLHSITGMVTGNMTRKNITTTTTTTKEKRKGDRKEIDKPCQEQALSKSPGLVKNKPCQTTLSPYASRPEANDRPLKDASNRLISSETEASVCLCLCV